MLVRSLSVRMLIQATLRAGPCCSIYIALAPAVPKSIVPQWYNFNLLWCGPEEALLYLLSDGRELSARTFNTVNRPVNVYNTIIVVHRGNQVIGNATKAVFETVVFCGSVILIVCAQL